MFALAGSVGYAEVKRSERESGIELLRIVSMLLIVLSHCFVHTQWEGLSLARQALVNSLCLGEVGVVCFVLITGYFSWKRPFRARGLFKIVLEIVFYNVVCYAIAVIFRLPGSGSFVLFPIVFGAKWFATVYVALMLFQPFLNGLIRSLGRVGHERLIVICFIVMSLVPHIGGVSYLSSNLAYCMFLYVLGAYFGKYPSKVRSIGLQWLIVGSLGSLLLIVGATAFATVSPTFGVMTRLTPSSTVSLNSPFVLACGLTLFLLATRLRLGSVHLINAVSAGTFGVYLISDSSYLRSAIWSVADNVAFCHSSIVIFVAHAFMTVLVIYIVCTVADVARIRFVEQPLFSLLDKRLATAYRGIDTRMGQM